MIDEKKLIAEIEGYKSAAEHFLKYKDNLEHWRTQKDLCDKLLSFINSLDTLNLSNVERTVKNWKEPVNRTPGDVESAMQEVEEKSRAFTEAHQGEDADTILAQMRGEELVSEDLEEASKEWLRPQLDKSYANYGEAKMMELTHFDGYAMLDAIEFGANWQKEQDKKWLADNHKQIYDNGYEEGFEAGRDDMEEQMMKDAVGGVVHHYGDNEIAAIHYNDPGGVPMSYFVSSKGLNAGDKVKIKIFKED